MKKLNLASPQSPAALHCDFTSKNNLESLESIVDYNGHEYVDLGLPSGIKWATCNIGADSSSDYGNYYAWGEITTKDTYTEKNSKTYDKQELSDIDISGNPEYDAARVNWGGSWRLPTETEFEELLNQCTWTWTSQGNHNGYEVTGPNGNSIFLPAAGCRRGSSLYFAGENGEYWSSTPFWSDAENAYGLYFLDMCDDHYVDWTYRSSGHTIRPVSE